MPWQRGPAPGSQKVLDKTSPVRRSSLRADDTFESITELGSLELMSRDLGWAPYGPLKKSVSADSLSSVSSLGNSFGQDVSVGQVEVALEYEARAAALHVTLLQGKDLLEKEEARFESCFMRVSLLPAEHIVGISRVSPRPGDSQAASVPRDPRGGTLSLPAGLCGHFVVPACGVSLFVTPFRGPGCCGRWRKGLGGIWGETSLFKCPQKPLS